MKKIDWYFDFISPFAYLALKRFNTLPKDIEINPIPILFAGLLNHYDTKGPAEIERMRQYTFRHIVWLAEQFQIPLTLPPAHPFNPLKYLRLSLLLENDLKSIETIFDFIWKDGQSAEDASNWEKLAIDFSISDIDSKISQQHIKDQLMSNTQQAVDLGIFGVPTFVVDEEMFFGQDSMEFLTSYLQNPEILKSQAMRSADILPEGITRK
ncbi:2-hydroxychromene-2-carboxylate isomerase [Cocleimonas flava]|uniref:2-hydroxychromene-2-carboxylate isomerase n=1 Tax=Cocleimonas flava TaxID=634765 RepID=A0A4R1EYS8_9GAMM|nr:DsbA family protein [Cocleimonas flava]TCJ87056.1 2-hydroxychromene-2-carboxylate isomerase [Cocleimonas flava]